MPILNEAQTALNTLTTTDIAVVRSMKNPPANVKLVMESICILKVILFYICMYIYRNRYKFYLIISRFIISKEIKPDKAQTAEGKSYDDYWKASLKILADVKFLDSLVHFDKDNIPDQVIDKIRREYLANPNFDPDKVKVSSTACEGLCKWVFAMSEYDKVAKVVAPKKKALAEAQQVYNDAMDKLSAKRAQLREVQVN